MTTPTQIVETPVTGLPGRTPRAELEVPLTNGREIEPVILIDRSRSNLEQVSPDSPMTKAELTRTAVPLIVGGLASLDSQAKNETGTSRGGVRAFTFNEPGELHFPEDEDESDDERDLGDLQEANVQEKLAAIEFDGRTYVMPAVRAAERAFQAEFSTRPLRNRPTCGLVVWTDGALSDPDEFEEWVKQADETLVVCTAVIGYGPGHDRAVEHWQKIAQGNRYVTVDALTGVSDPMEVAYDVMHMLGKTSA